MPEALTKVNREYLVKTCSGCDTHSFLC